MDLKRIYAVALRYSILLQGSPQRLMQIVIWGGLDVLLFGFLTRYLGSVSSTEFALGPALIGGIILLDVLMRVQQGTTTPALEDIWSNNLLNYFASPLRISEYVCGLIASSAVTTTLATTTMVLLAHFVFGFSLFAIGLPLAGFLVILFLFGIALGILGITIVLRFGPSAEWYVWPMTAALSPLVGVLYPVSVLPTWLQSISYLLPPTYVFEGMRSILMQGTYSPMRLLIGFVLSLGFLGLSYLLLQVVYRSVVRMGLLARYNAEGV